MGNIDIAVLVSHLVMFLVNLLLAISAHEAAHAWMSHKFGDDTAYMLGRVTLNPVKHTDPIGTLAIPIIGFFFGAMGGALGRIPLIGWGKPTPVDPRKWTNYKLANVMVSIAGVLANLILLLIGIVIAKIMISQGFLLKDFFGESQNALAIFVGKLMTLNLSLFVFNLLPIPPLDGSKILSTFLPDSFQPAIEMLEQFGFILLLLFLYLGLFDLIFHPFVHRSIHSFVFIIFMKKRIFSGAQPTGELHIGNYLGALKNWVNLQNEYESFFCIVNLHAITLPQKPEILKQKTLDLARIYLASGVDPEVSTIFIQSDVSEHAELAWVLSCIARMGELERMTQFKDKGKGNTERAGVGLFTYPVLMASDILLYTKPISFRSAKIRNNISNFPEI